MVFVRFTRRCAGDGWEAERGDVRGLPDAEARRFIARNHAEEVEAPVAPAPPPRPTDDTRTEPPSAATVAAPERAVQPRARGRV